MEAPERSTSPSPVVLAPREQAVLTVLVHHAGRVLDRDELRHEAGLDALSERRCESLLVGVRRKLGPGAIVTVRQRGWMLSRDALAMALAIISALGGG